MYALASRAAPRLIRSRYGTMCTAKGSDVRPGVPWGSTFFMWQAWDNLHCQGIWCTPWRPLGLRLFCVAGKGQCALPRSLMYALASLGAPLLLRDRRGIMCIAKGLDKRPGRCGICIYSFTHLLTHVRTHARTQSPTSIHTHTQSLTPSLPHSPTSSFPLHLPSLHFISLHSLTHIHYYHHHHYVPAMFTSHRACRKS